MTDAPLARPQPTLATLLKRLADYGAVDKLAGLHASHPAPHPVDLAIAIEAHALDCVICAGAMVDGKWRVLRFSDYYRELFGRELDGRLVKPKRRTA